MPPKRPKLEQLQLLPEEKGVSITDTCTLVVPDGGGAELRVKDSGIALDTSKTTQSTGEAEAADDTVGDKIKFEDLRLGSELGKGSQGKVKVAVHRVWGKKYALKCIQFGGDSDCVKQSLQSELRQVKALKHKNLVSSHEAFFRDGRLYIVLEYMDAGSISDVVKKHPEGINEELLAYVARELLRGLESLHSSKVIHRDIKPANILANSKGEIKIADFGVAKTFLGEDMKTLSSQGSVSYMSPERIRGQPYSFSSDIWSAGLTVAELVLGRSPFGIMKQNLYDLCQVIATEKVEIDWVVGDRKFSNDLRDFVYQCLQQADLRPTASALLNHAFIKKSDHVDPASAGRWFINLS